MLDAARSSIAFTDQLPLAFRGERADPEHGAARARKPAVDARQSAIIAQMYRDTPLAAPVNEGFAMRDDVMQRAMRPRRWKPPSRNAITPRGFELEARRIARLMRERFNLGFVDVGGWDTHVGQGGATAISPTASRSSAADLRAFAEEMGSAWRDTVVVVISEFGRTFRENGNRGTDHGHGSVYWVLRRLGARRAHRRRAGAGLAGDAVPEPRLSRAQRIPRSPRRLVRAHLRPRCAAARTNLSFRLGEGPGASLAAAVDEA